MNTELYGKTVYIFKLLVRFPTRKYLSLSCLKLLSVRNGPIKTKEIFLKYPFFKSFTIPWNVVCGIVPGFCRSGHIYGGLWLWKEILPQNLVLSTICKI